MSRTKNPVLDQWITEHFFVDGWLKQYWMYQLNNAQSELTPEERDNRWKKLEKQWNERFNSSFDYYSYRITYKNVIANALEAGPLKNRYLVVKKDELQLGKKVKEKDKKRFDYLYQSTKNTPVDTKMKIIKLIAAYLIRQENHPEGQKEVWIKNSELANWYGLDDGKNGNITWYPKRLSWNGKSIYTRKIIKGSYSKVIINPDYLKKFDFHIIEVTDAAEYRDTHWILEDKGHGLSDCWNIIK